MCASVSVPSDKFWDAIRKWEHRRQLHPKEAKDGLYPEERVNKGEYALGALQIRRKYHDDAVEHDRTLQSGQSTHEKCLAKEPSTADQRLKSFEYSKKVGNAYMARYATAKRLGRTPTEKDFARIHNGGPTGWKDLPDKPDRNKKLNEYWLGVKAILDSQ